MTYLIVLLLTFSAIFLLGGVVLFLDGMRRFAAEVQKKHSNAAQTVVAKRLLT